MNPEDAAVDYLVTYLEADGTLMGMLNGQVAPEVRWGTLASPFIRIDLLDGSDLIVIGLHRIWGDMQFNIRGVDRWEGSGRPDRTTVNAIGARLYDLLHAHEIQNSEIVFHSFREESLPTPSVTEPNGELWLQSGGIYRVRAEPV